MKIASLQVGQALILDQEHCTIVRITEDNLCYLERTKDLAILTRKKVELINLFLAEKVIFQGKETDKKSIYTNRQAMDLKTLPEKQQNRALKRYEYIKQAEKQYIEPCCIGLESIIAKVSQQLTDPNPPSPITLYRWWQRWRNMDCNITALINQPRGRKGHRKFKDQFNAVFNELLEAIYLKREKCTRQTFHLALCHKIKQHNQITAFPLTIPSQATTYRMLDKVDKYLVMAAKFGRRKADQYFRSVGKGVMPEHILERVEVDHTQLDVMVVDEKTGLVIGRPYLTGLLDVKSRMPMSLNMGFEPPSYLSVIRALKQAILPKEYINQCYPDIKNTWPIFGIPNTLICDNALEFHSKQLTRVCAELNIELILSYQYKRKLSHQGVQFLQLFYNSEALKTIRIRYGNKAKVTIRVDLENLGKIWVYDQYSGEYLIIPCTEPDYAEGLTLRQHKAILKQRIENKYHSIDSDNVLELKEAVRQKIQQANQTKSLRQRTRAKRLDTPPLTAPYDINNNKLSNNQYIEPNFLLDDLAIPDFEIIKYGENEE